MCGRYTHLLTWRQIVELYQLTSGLEAPSEFRPRYNIAPTQVAPVVRMRDGQRELAMLRWGLIPAWAKDRAIGNKMINLDVAGPRLPAPVTVAIAPGQSLKRPFAMAGPRQPLNFQLHQPLGGKADHLPKHIGIRALLKQRTKRHHLIGHRGHRCSCCDQTLPESHDDRRCG